MNLLIGQELMSQCFYSNKEIILPSFSTLKTKVLCVVTTSNLLSP